MPECHYMIRFFSHIFEIEAYHQPARDFSNLNLSIRTFTKSQFLEVVFILQNARQIFQTLVSNEA